MNKHDVDKLLDYFSGTPKRTLTPKRSATIKAMIAVIAARKDNSTSSKRKAA